MFVVVFFLKNNFLWSLNFKKLSAHPGYGTASAWFTTLTSDSPTEQSCVLKRLISMNKPFKCCLFSQSNDDFPSLHITPSTWTTNIPTVSSLSNQCIWSLVLSLNKLCSPLSCLFFILLYGEDTKKMESMAWIRARGRY